MSLELQAILLGFVVGSIAGWLLRKRKDRRESLTDRLGE